MPTARGCAGALVAVAIVVAALSAPSRIGDTPVFPRIERLISSARGGKAVAPVPGRHKGLGELDRVLAQKMPTLPESDRTRLADVIYQEAREGSLDPLLVLAVIAVESGFDHDAESHRGAVGLMQLKPTTLRAEAERSGLDADDPDDPAFNVRTGVRYFRRLVRAFGSTEIALMAYNAGPNRILRYLQDEGAIPDRFMAYPKRVQDELRRLRRGKAPVVEDAVAAEQRRAKAIASAAPVQEEAGASGAVVR